MKKLFLIIAMALTIGVASAQDYVVEDGYIKMVKVIENTGLSSDDSHEQMAVFMASFFNDVNETCKVNTPTKLVYKFEADVANVNKGLGVVHTYYAEYELTLSFKDNRMRVVLTAYNIDSHDMVNYYKGYNPAHAIPVVDDYDPVAVGVAKKHAQAIFNGLMHNMEAVMQSVEDGLQQMQSEDNW